MKKYLLLMICAGLFLAGCSEKRTSVEIREDQSVKTGEIWDIIVNKHIYSSANTEIRESLDVLNSRIKSLEDSLFNSIKQECDEYCPPPGEQLELRYQLQMNDTVYRATDDLISVRIMTYTYRLGAAHGTTDFYAYNYDIKNRRFLTPEAILDFTAENRINEVLAANFKNNECFLEKPAIKGKSYVLNIGNNELTFTYPAYELGPYACGFAVIDVPENDLKDYIKVRNVR